MEIVEVLPAEDHADVTSLLASRVVLEALAATIVRRRGGAVAGYPRGSTSA
jgi:arginase family enzyme